MEVSRLGQFCKCPHSAYHGAPGRGQEKSHQVPAGILIPQPLGTFTFLFMKLLRKHEISCPVPGWHSIGVYNIWLLLCIPGRDVFWYCFQSSLGYKEACLCVALLLKPPLHLHVMLPALFRFRSKYLSVVPDSTWLPVLGEETQW